MATITVPFGEAEDRHFTATLSYDDVTDLIVSLDYTLLLGNAHIVIDGATAFACEKGTTRSVSGIAGRPLDKGRGLGFGWGRNG